MFWRRIVDWLELRRGAAPTWVYDFAWTSAVSGLAEHCLDALSFSTCWTTRTLPASPVRVRPSRWPIAFTPRSSASSAIANPGWSPYDRAESVMVFDTE
jgi:para-nitrobenzyl esterase